MYFILYQNFFSGIYKFERKLTNMEKDNPSNEKKWFEVLKEYLELSGKKKVEKIQNGKAKTKEPDQNL